MFLLLVLFLHASMLHLQAQNLFNKGVNLTNWFQSENVQSLPFTKFTRQDLQDIKSLGCDVIRLPVNLHYMTSGAPDFVIDPLLFTYLDTVVDWAEKLQINLILDNHTIDGANNISIEGAYIAYDIGMNYDPNNVLHLKENKDALIPYFHKYHVVVPVTGNYYLDKIIPHTDQEKVNAAVSLIDMGLNMYKKQEEEKQRKENLKHYLIWGGVGFISALLLGIFLYRRKNQSP